MVFGITIHQTISLYTNKTFTRKLMEGSRQHTMEPSLIVTIPKVQPSVVELILPPWLYYTPMVIKRIPFYCRQNQPLNGPESMRRWNIQKNIHIFPPRLYKTGNSTESQEWNNKSCIQFERIKVCFRHNYSSNYKSLHK